MNSKGKTDGTEGGAAMARGEVLEETGREKATESRRGPKVSHGTVRGDPSGHHPWSKHQSKPDKVRGQ